MKYLLIAAVLLLLALCLWLGIDGLIKIGLFVAFGLPTIVMLGILIVVALLSVRVLTR